MRVPPVESGARDRVENVPIVANRVIPYLIAALIGVIVGTVVSPWMVAVLAVLAFAGVWTYLDRHTGP
jgi:Flp pilus assembly protein TadB